MHFETFFRKCFVRKLRFHSKLISYSESALKTESIHICFKQFCEKYFFWKKSLYPLRNGLVNDDNFFDSSVISWRTILIFFSLARYGWDNSVYKISAQSDVIVKSYRVNGRTHWPILECTHFLSTQKPDYIYFLFLKVILCNPKYTKTLLNCIKSLKYDRIESKRYDKNF